MIRGIQKTLVTVFMHSNMRVVAVHKYATGVALIPEPKDFQHYLEEVLGITPLVHPWQEAQELPLFLRQGYTFFSAEILKTAVLLAIDKDRELRSPTTITKQLQEVEKRCSKPVVFVRNQLASFQRKRLIEQKTAFVIPGNQMYLPMLAIDLREHFRQLRDVSSKLSPATQATVIQMVLKPQLVEMNSKEVAGRLGYTKMTMSRTFNELENLELVEILHRGRERVLIPPRDRRLLWTKAEPFLQSPIKSIHHVSRFEGVGTVVRNIGTIAGLSALARYSMLADSKVPVIAVTSRQWREQSESLPKVKMHSDDPDALSVEVWNYDPHLFSDDGVADRLSLYLSLKHVADERVEMALEEMMEKIPW